MSVTPGPPFDGHLVLIGLPGAGKSTIGRAVANRLHRPFLDFDVEIERRTGLTIAQLFAQKGEPTFRQMEVELTYELAAAPPMVVAPGGGWVTNRGVMALLRPRARIIHLRVSPTEALRRLSRSRVIRPLLLVTNPTAVMNNLWSSRAELYEQADIEINVEVHDSQRVIDAVLALAIDLTSGLG